MRLSVADLCEAQRDRGLTDVHLVSTDNAGFSVAHTDEERASGLPLAECPLHAWLVTHDVPPVESGTYVVTAHEPDQYSEPYRVTPWEFNPVDLPCPVCDGELFVGDGDDCSRCSGLPLGGPR